MAELIRAIYVEDEPTVRDLLPRVLEMAGIRVTLSCASAEELLDKRETKMYAEADVYVFDVRLPGMSGLELAKKLRREGEKRPIVAVSAWPAPPGEDLGAINVTYLRKPFDFDELENMIKGVAKS